MCLKWSAIGVFVASMMFSVTSLAATISADFTLLSSPALAGYKPSASLPAVGDWLTGTGDDSVQPSVNNPSGALSHSFADFAGMGGAGFNMAPSLSGSLSLELTAGPALGWDVSVTDLAYSGQATAVMFMNQFLVKPGSAATQNPVFQVDGVGNAGSWQNGAAGNWAIAFELDFLIATNADGDPSPNDVDAAFDDRAQTGYLIPTTELTAAGLSQLALDDPAGFFSGDLRDYLLNIVAPLLPPDATYLLFTQMSKVHPDYAEAGLPITTAGLIGNTTIAYTTAVVPEPTSLVLLAFATAALVLRKVRGR